MSAQADINDDGTPDSYGSMEAEETRTELKSHFEDGDIPTGTDFTQTSQPTGASWYLDMDDDGDDVAERRCAAVSDTGGAGVSASNIGLSSEISVRKGWDGTIKGRMTIDDGATNMIMFDSDGNGYVSGKVGIGVITPTEKIDVAGGANCDGTNWNNASDAALKENFQPINGEELLEKLMQLQITRWNYKGMEGAEHIGPTAQDFKAIFGLGSGDKTISTVDPSGIALAAIKELGRQNRELKDQNDELKQELDELKRLVKEAISNK